MQTGKFETWSKLSPQMLHYNKRLKFHEYLQPNIMNGIDSSIQNVALLKLNVDD